MCQPSLRPWAWPLWLHASLYTCIPVPGGYLNSPNSWFIFLGWPSRPLLFSLYLRLTSPSFLSKTLSYPGQLPPPAVSTHFIDTMPLWVHMWISEPSPQVLEGPRKRMGSRAPKLAPPSYPGGMAFAEPRPGVGAGMSDASGPVVGWSCHMGAPSPLAQARGQQPPRRSLSASGGGGQGQPWPLCGVTSLQHLLGQGRGCGGTPPTSPPLPYQRVKPPNASASRNGRNYGGVKLPLGCACILETLISPVGQHPCSHVTVSCDFSKPGEGRGVDSWRRCLQAHGEPKSTLPP